eukprot:scaffold1026_cov409-Prasinococcus_capsulatus_cf.AAC.10
MAATTSGLDLYWQSTLAQMVSWRPTFSVTPRQTGVRVLWCIYQKVMEGGGALQSSFVRERACI